MYNIGSTFFLKYQTELSTYTNCFPKYDNEKLTFYKDSKFKHRVISFKIDEMINDCGNEPDCYDSIKNFIKRAVILANFHEMEM